jgi:hypothetical protein
MFGCKHKWQILSEKTTKSKFEVAREALEGVSRVKIPWQMCDASRKVIQIVTCEKCGKIKKFVTEV